MNQKLTWGATVLVLLMTLGACSAQTNTSVANGAAEASTDKPGAQSGDHTGSGANGNAQGGPQGAGAPGGAGGPGLGGGALTVQAVTVTNTTLMGENTTSGTVEAVWQSKVPSQVAGTVSKVLLKAGDWVKSGQVVVQLDTTQLELTLADAQATLENAKISLDTEASSTTQEAPKLQYQLTSAQSAYNAAEKVYNANQAAFKLGGLSESDLDTAKATFDTAKANLESAKAALETNKSSDSQSLATLRNTVKKAEIAVSQAQLNLKNASIKAPFDGQVSSIAFLKGEYVAAAATAFVLVSPEKQVAFNIAPADAARLTQGAKVSFTYNAQSWDLVVSNSSSAPTAGLVPMVAVSKSSLPAYGMVGTVHYSMVLGSGAQVPLNSLQTKNNANYVYTVEDGKVATQAVSIVAENGSVAVLKGLTLPAQVILSPPPGLVVGAAVKVADQGKGTSS
jgi:HlyD family secretion protein